MDLHHVYEFIYIDDETNEKTKGTHCLADIVDPELWPDHYIKPHAKECDCTECKAQG